MKGYIKKGKFDVCHYKISGFEKCYYYSFLFLRIKGLSFMFTII